MSVKLYGILGHQRNRSIITGVIKATELFKIYEIDIWQPGKPIEEQGCQRPPIKSHYTKIARKLKDDTKATLPTSITFSANTHCKSQEDKNSIKIKNTSIGNVVQIEISNGSKLKVIDGQHRILGLSYAITDLKITDMTLEELKNFELPFVIMLVENRVDEIKCFYEINSTPKKVPTDLALQLLNEMNNNSNINLNKTERWKLIGLNIAMNLKNRPDSVWFNNISEGKQQGEICTSTSFVTSLKPFFNIEFVQNILKRNINDERKAGQDLTDLVNNYWNALKETIPQAFPDVTSEKFQWTIQKTAGFFVWNMLAPFILEDCMLKREKISNFSTDNIAKFIKEYAEYGVKDYELVWRSSNKEKGIKGGDASMANSMKAFSALADLIKNDIDENYWEKQKVQVIF